MWIADQWKEYEVIDASCGEKLERWGSIPWSARTHRLSGILLRQAEAGKT